MSSVPENLQHLLHPIADLHPDPANARVHNQKNLDAIKSSLAQFGQVKPIVARKETNVVIAGNGTMEAAVELGWSEIAVVFVAMSMSEATAFAIADNRTSELGDWDKDTLSSLVESLGDEKDLMLSMGFTRVELDNLMSEHEEENDDGSSQLGDGLVYQVVVTAKDEGHQMELLGRLQAEGLECRALIS